MSCRSVASVEDLSSHESNSRKRVGKACDRCRLKKSKCDGSKPCSRCKADNQLCLFGERKKAHDKIYPKGYVELLEHQQSLLVNALQLVYRQNWTGSALPEVEGAPLVHDMLESLGLLQEESASSPVSFEGFHFEEDPSKMQARLAESETGVGRRSSRSSISPPNLSPVSTQPTLFRDALSPMGPSTPQDQHAFPSHTMSPSSGMFPYAQHTARSGILPSQFFQLAQHAEVAKHGDMNFPSYIVSGMPQDGESLGPYSAPFPMMSAYSDIGDFMEDDTFSTLVDLTAP